MKSKYSVINAKILTYSQISTYNVYKILSRDASGHIGLVTAKKTVVIIYTPERGVYRVGEEFSECFSSTLSYISLQSGEQVTLEQE